MDVAVITSQVATGSAIDSAEDAAYLAELGVTGVVNCRAEFDDAPLLPLTMAYLWNGVIENTDPKPLEWYQRTLEWALPHLEEDPNHMIYFHCRGGQDRGPSHAYMVLRAQGYDQGVARDMIHRERPVAGLYFAREAEDALRTLGYDV